MPTIITITKAATAYQELEKDTPEVINADHISKIISAPEFEQIGASILFFYDGRTMNIVETVSQVEKIIRKKRQDYFEHNFSLS